MISVCFGYKEGVFKKAYSYVVRGLVPHVLSVNVLLRTGHKGRDYVFEHSQEQAEVFKYFKRLV
jgi:hypothetical protein